MTTPVIQIQWDEATRALQAAKSVVIVTHIAPDGDAIGSLLGLTHALQAMGKKVTPAVDDGVPESLKFIPGSHLIESSLKEGGWDLMISTDASDEVRTGGCGAYARANSKTVINLDHHATNIMFGDIILVVSAAVSATEVAFDWLGYMKQPVNEQTATALLTGLVTDTLGFRTSGVTARTLEIAQALMSAGAPLSWIMARTLESKAYIVIDLWKSVLPHVELDGKVISAAITRADYDRVAMTETSDGGLVSLLNRVNEARVAVVFKEKEDGDIEISLRSKAGYDVAEVAFALGGGGHKQASGATIDGPLDAARNRVMPLLYEAVKQGKLSIG